MIWTIENKQVRSPNGAVVTFEFDVKETLEVCGILVVLLNVPPNRVMTENVFGVSADGKLLWQIEHTSANSTDPTNAYTAISGYKDCIVHVYNWNGTDNAVDAITGKLLSTGIAK